MVYMGSKNRISKYIIPIILKNRLPGQTYVELFCGGCNLIDKISGPRIANDNNVYLIELFKHVIAGRDLPLHITQEEYWLTRDYKETLFDFWYTGFVGFCCSYAGKFFDGYTGHTRTVATLVRDYIKESRANILKQAKNLKDVVFLSGDYRNVLIPQNSIVYLDPPYKDTRKYHSKFIHEEFYAYIRLLVTQGPRVFISGYEMPEDFVCVWSKEIRSSLSANGVSGNSRRSTEKLFVHESQLDI